MAYRAGPLYKTGDFGQIGSLLTKRDVLCIHTVLGIQIEKKTIEKKNIHRAAPPLQNRYLLTK